MNTTKSTGYYLSLSCIALLLTVVSANAQDARRPWANRNPRDANRQPFALSDYSGKDVVGIEAIVDESLADSQPWRQQASERIDRFGNQTPPETIYKRLQYFEKFNLPIAATEFEMKDTIGDELDKAAMTERVMTVLFSHRLVNGIFAWTIMSRDRAIVEASGRLNLRGKVWLHLMKNRWWTDETLTTDANGTVNIRGFKGDYTILVGGDAVELKLDEDQQSDFTQR